MCTEQFATFLIWGIRPATRNLFSGTAQKSAKSNIFTKPIQKLFPSCFKLKPTEENQ